MKPLDHLLDIQSLSDEALNSLLSSAQRMKADPDRFRGVCSGSLMVNLFFESSTRTRISFEIAAFRLGMKIVNFSATGSSLSKGETLIDSFRTVQAMGPDVIVLRHPDIGSAARLAQEAVAGVHLINAGDGSHAHPSQALLDLMTLQQHFDDLSSIKVLIAGGSARSGPPWKTSSHSKFARKPNAKGWKKISISISLSSRTFSGKPMIFLLKLM